ncbi:uncharacterized protein LOC117106279 [Anneissia japonica]|uniref:uncharacterized protein LOC117106279 n=1 Tax=Anneissia japonica TaxID=1529436 RepID=UPI0014255F32|nr:uncharacterized protein LOC117106279 [Anneissia japonica]
MVMRCEISQMLIWQLRRLTKVLQLGCVLDTGAEASIIPSSAYNQLKSRFGELGTVPDLGRSLDRETPPAICRSEVILQIDEEESNILVSLKHSGVISPCSTTELKADLPSIGSVNAGGTTD